MLPSVVEALPSNGASANGYYTFKFACFGTDAQAIKIAFIDNINRYGAKYFTIEFNNNGGAGRLQSQKVPLGNVVNLKKNTAIYKTGASFLGWNIKATVDGMSMPTTIVPDPEDSSKNYLLQDMAEISNERLENSVKGLKIVPGSTVTLFAVWESYTAPEDETYTVMKVECDSPNQQISPLQEYEFVPGAKPVDTVVVDYGD